jgi:S2P endopeptidase
MIDRRGYCVPYYLIKESITARVESNETTCPDELYAFASTPCLDSHMSDDVRNEENHLQGRGRIHCFNPKDVIKLKKCANSWDKSLRNSSSCSCLEVYSIIACHTQMDILICMGSIFA